MIKRVKSSNFIVALLIIGLGTVTTIAAVRYFNVSGRNIRLIHAAQQIQTLTDASYEWLAQQKQDNFTNQEGGVDISLTQLVDADLITDTPENTRNPWGGKIIVEPGSDPSHVKITMTGIPQQDCKKLADRLDTISKITMPDCHQLQSNEYSGEF